MINCNELRIGNLFEYNFATVAVVAIYRNGFTCEGDEVFLSDDEMKEVEPIQLTAEWLVKFGFKSIDRQHNLIFKKRKWNIILPTPRSTAKVAIILYKGSIGNYHTTIKYVHQLQNIYFAIIGEEIKLQEAAK